MTNTLSTNLTNYAATPPLVINGRLDGGLSKRNFDTVEAPVLSINDTVMLARVPVDAVLGSIQLATDDLGTTGILDYGFYKRNADGTFTAVLAAAIATGLDVNAAAVAFTERRFSVLDINTVQKQAWELAGLSVRPSYDYLYIGLVATTATTAIGTVSQKLEYTL